jgi:hypothetical protein
MIAYLDTKVFDRLYKRIGCTSANIADLRKAVYGRSLSMPIGIHVLEELLLNRHASPQELVARVKLTLSLASIRRMVKPCDQLIADDIRSYAGSAQPARPLAGAEIQNVFTQGIAELIESDGEEFSEEILAALETTRLRRERFLQAMTNSCRQAAAMLEAMPSSIAFDDYFERAAVPMAERFAQRAGTLEACRERGMSGLLQLKSVRAAVGIALSLVYGQALEGWTATADDSGDFLHAPCAAASAEIFVTDDPRIRMAIERVALDGLRIMNLTEFLAECTTAEKAD